MSGRRGWMEAALLGACLGVGACGGEEAPPRLEAPGLAPLEGEADREPTGGGGTALTPAAPSAESVTPAPAAAPTQEARWLWLHRVADENSQGAPSLALGPQGTTALLTQVHLTAASGFRSVRTLEVRAWGPDGAPAWTRQAAGMKPDDLEDYTWRQTLQPWGEGFALVEPSWRDHAIHALDFGCAVHQAAGDNASRVLFFGADGVCVRDADVAAAVIGFDGFADGRLWFSYTIPGAAGQLYPLTQWDAEGHTVATSPYDSAHPKGTDVAALAPGLLLTWGDGALTRLEEDTLALRWRLALPLPGRSGRPFLAEDGRVGVLLWRNGGQGFSFGSSVVPAGEDIVLLWLSSDGVPLSAAALGLSSAQVADAAADGEGVVALVWEAARTRARLVAVSATGEPRWQTVVAEARAGGTVTLEGPRVHPVHGVRVAGTLQGPVTLAGAELDAGERAQAFVGALAR